MKNQSAKEILSFTFAYLDKVLWEKRKEKGEVRDKAGGRSTQVWGQEEPAAPESAAEANIRGGMR